MDDISEKLLADIKKDYNKQFTESKTILSLAEKLKTNKATYKDAYVYANEVGNIRAKVFKNHLSSSVLPNGKMYFNIADKVVGQILERDFNDISAVCTRIQQIANKNGKIGLATKTPKYDQDAIMGFVNRLSSEEVYDDVAWILEEPLKTYARKVVDKNIETNAKFQYSAGIKASIIRTADSKCCEWCDNLAGTYEYPSVPSEVFMRHDNCKCSLEYYGKKLTAYDRNFME